MRIITIAALVLLAACDAGFAPNVTDPGIVNCENVIHGGEVRFDNRDITLWRGTSGMSLDVNDEITKSRIKLRMGDGWKCTPPTGKTEML